MTDQIPGSIIPARTRKRILDPDIHEDDNNARRPSLFSDWQDNIKTIGVPHKKGNTSFASLLQVIFNAKINS